jgi:hypothetical protein
MPCKQMLQPLENDWVVVREYDPYGHTRGTPLHDDGQLRKASTGSTAIARRAGT